VKEAMVVSDYDLSFNDIGYELPLDVDVRRLVEKLEKFMVSKSGNLLPSVQIKGKSGSYYYSVSDKYFKYVDRQSEFYLLPWKKYEGNRVYVYTPYTFKQGIIILVPEDEIILLGFN
jgi:hypothetical protein